MIGEPVGDPLPARRSFVIAAVLAVLAMTSIEATIVSTAMPYIAGRLGGLHLYSWVFSSYLLTQTASTLVFGKLADLYGRRAVLLVGIGIFLVGSILCGFAWSMLSLVVFRLVQGLGAGAVLPVSITVVGDLYPMQERGRVQAWISTVWGVSSIIGPIVGALIVQQFSWAWIFWINLPIGLAAAAGFFLFLKESSIEKERSVDSLGAILLAAMVAALMMAINGPGVDSYAIMGAMIVSIIAFGLLLLQERRAPDPIIAFELWLDRAVAATNMVTLFCSMAVIGLTTFLPIYAQKVMGQTPLIAGFMLTAMLFGWPIASIVAARNFMSFGLKPIIVAGTALLTLGSLAFLILAPTSSPALAGLGSLVMGFGMGLVSTAGQVLIQNHVGWDKRGAATASNIFSRNLGNTLGAAVLGAVLNASSEYGKNGPLKDMHDFNRNRDFVMNAISAPANLADGLHATFCGLFLISLAALFCSAFIPAKVGYKEFRT